VELLDTTRTSERILFTSLECQAVAEAVDGGTLWRWIPAGVGDADYSMQRAGGVSRAVVDAQHVRRVTCSITSRTRVRAGLEKYLPVDVGQACVSI